MTGVRTRDSLRRALHIACTLAERGLHGVPLSELVERTGASRATVYRDLKLLRDAGFEVESCNVDSTTRVRLVLKHPRPRLGPDDRERLALRLIRHALPALEGSFVAQTLDALLTRGSTKGVKPQQAPKKSGPTAEVLDTIARAIRTQRRLTFRYRGSRSETEERRTVDPMELRLVRDQLYLVAWDVDRDAARTFKPVRMTAAFAMPEPARKHRIDVDALFANSVRVWDAASVEVVVRLTRDKARFVREWPLHPAQHVKEQPDRSVLVRAHVAGLVEATRWVLGWGKGARVVAPEELRAAVVAELEGALAGYGVGKRSGRRAGESHGS